MGRDDDRRLFVEQERRRVGGILPWAEAAPQSDERAPTVRERVGRWLFDRLP